MRSPRLVVDRFNNTPGLSHSTNDAAHPAGSAPRLPAVTSRRRAATVRRLERSTGTLATAASARMESEHPWYAAMSADDRSWVNLVAQAGIAAFVQWFRDPEGAQAITADVFGTAPLELVRAVSLQQTVDLVRTTIAVVEERVDELAGEEDAAWLREGLLLYSREIAFAAAAGLRPRRRGARRLGRAARVAGARRAAARRPRRRRRVARAPRWAGGSSPASAWSTGHAPDGDPEMVAEAVQALRAAPRPRRDHRRPGPAARRGAGQRDRPGARHPRRARPLRARVRSWWGRSCPPLADATRSARESLAGFRAADGVAGRATPRRGRTTCCPSARSTATPTRSACSSTRCTSRCRPRTRR